MKRKYTADPLAMFKVFNKVQPFTSPELVRLELPIRLAFDALKSGKGTEQDFHDLAAAINTTMIRAEEIGHDCEVVALEARDALMRTYERWQAVGKWGFDGPALETVEFGIDLHEQLCRLSTPLQMMVALREVVRRGKVGNSIDVEKI